MTDRWVRYRLTAELLSDAHLGSGAGGVGVDALVARDRHGWPVIWASHIEGVLRDAARRLHGDAAAQRFFGRAGGDYERADQQRAIFTSLYAKGSPTSRIWRSTARKAFYNRAPKEDTLRAAEFVPKGTEFEAEVELPESELPVLERLVREVDALGSGRATGAGRIRLSLVRCDAPNRAVGSPKERLLLLLKNRDPLCITATATPDNLIPSLAFVPGRALLGAIAAWLISAGERETASLLTSGRIAVSNVLPLPQEPARIESVEVLPAPLTLQSEKPTSAVGEVPWWAQPVAPPRRIDTWSTEEELKRPEDDLFVFREDMNSPWIAYRPARRIRLRNGRPDLRQAEPSLFAIEQIVEKTPFLAELRGSLEDMKQLAEKLSPVLQGQRWLRVGRGGAPVEVVRVAWCKDPAIPKVQDKARLVLTSDLLVRDEYLRWRTDLDTEALRTLFDSDVQFEKSLQDSTMVHGFNGTSRLWRMPAAAIRRGSVFEISGPGVAKLAERAAKGEWRGERTHEGFGRFRIDAVLPGVTDTIQTPREPQPVPDSEEEAVAATTKQWFDQHQALAKPGSAAERKPSLSQWFDLVAELERRDPNALTTRLHPTTAGAKTWAHPDARAILEQLQALEPAQRVSHARYFVRWLRLKLRTAREKEGR